MSELIFTVTPETSFSDVISAAAANSAYGKITFMDGDHYFPAELDIFAPGLAVEVSEAATLSPTLGVDRLLHVHAPEVTITGSGTFDARSMSEDLNFKQFILVQDTADGIHITGAAKPDQANQGGALEFTGGRTAITFEGVDNLVAENLYLHHFMPGTYGIIVRDTQTQDGLNAYGEKGNILRDIYAHDASGGGLPGQRPANGSWIRLDTDEQGLAGTEPTLSDVTITDTILLGGTDGLGDDGRTYFLVNIDSNIDAARNIEIAYNSLANAASYEIQIKNGFESLIGIEDVLVHHNVMDHSDPDILRRWPLKVQSNFDSPFDATFENNLALLQQGYGPDVIHTRTRFVDDATFNGDFLTDHLRNVIRIDGDHAATAPLTGTGADEWILVSGAQTVISGDGADLIEYRTGDGAVLITDFKVGTDQLRLQGFGTVDLSDYTTAPEAADGVFDFGNGDVLEIRRDGLGIDLRGFTSADVVAAQTYHHIKVSNSDAVQGTDAADRIEGSEAADFLYGGAGNDILFGADGTDRLYGEDGDDRLVTGRHMDRLYGGAGADVFVFVDDTQLNIVYDFELGTDRISLVGVTYADLTFEVYGGRDTDIITPGGDRLVLRDILPEQLDNFDFILAADDINDVVRGGAGADILHGGNQADVLSTSAGIDRLYGFGAADVFVFTAESRLNIVYDFVIGVDQILLSGHDLEGLRIFNYNATDLEIRAEDNSRLVLRDVDITAFNEADVFVL